MVPQVGFSSYFPAFAFLLLVGQRSTSQRTLVTFSNDEEIGEGWTVGEGLTVEEVKRNVSFYYFIYIKPFGGEI